MMLKELFCIHDYKFMYATQVTYMSPSGKWTEINYQCQKCLKMKRISLKGHLNETQIKKFDKVK